MTNINTEDLRTIGDLSRELKYSSPKIRNIVAGIKPAIEAGNGRVVFYNKKDVVDALFERNKTLLQFMGYLSPEQSYDITVSPDAEASE
ncbi:hypothetical protein HWB39_gp23 [Streptomyces phage WRightOn]|uniref:Uncharacterized protein n=2 Tax=Manuelvirus TaxID=2842852 RepID=A0A2H4PI71_9CAUD|nr:hypothetical protein HWB39_gp23 [Streptomyces phage WRightOn]ATW62513.1 hypothetical protein SEA_WRIGHTON_80 [Streptomyces phage WRightOn]QNN98997.1 hypothetical protein SEA_ZEIGLE_76 [Streptomyces phage Zeigle]WNA15483.1 helix-turn-helix DNA binding domain protein [Streptomyces phage Kumquat]